MALKLYFAYRGCQIRLMTYLDYHLILYIFHPRGYFQFHQRNHLIDRSDVYNTDSLFDRQFPDYWYLLR